MSCPPAETTESRDFVTEEEFLRLPETTLRTELIDGVVVREPSPGFGHQAGVLRIARLLATWADVRSPSWCVLTARIQAFRPRSRRFASMLSRLRPALTHSASGN